MATHLDLEEQEQLDQLKHFWKQYGNLITWVLVIVLAGFAAYNLWNIWQRKQAANASAMYDALDRAAQGADMDKVASIFGDLKKDYPGTTFAEQGGLLAAKVQFDKNQPDNARASLAWVAENAKEDEYKTIARLRLAGLLMDEKKYDDALKQLDGATSKDFEALVADRRGDVLLAQGKKDDAKAAYLKAWAAMDPTVEYRRLIDAKLTAMGAAPAVVATKASEAKP